jgi:deoxycytidine triphosphate deaminase
MGVLSKEEIKKRKDEIFESGFEEKCLDIAAYNLRLNDHNMMIGGKKYDTNNPYDYRENEGFIKLPSRKISMLSTQEKLKLPNDLCARVGITFSWSMKGLIPLFGPQVDPCFNDYFYAIVYNLTGEDIKLNKGDSILKMEFLTIEGDINIPPFPHGFPKIESEMTEKDSVGDLLHEAKKINEKIDKLTTDVQINNAKMTTDIQTNNAKIELVESGYQNLVLFGIFLISASIFGVVLSFLLSCANYENLSELMGGGWLPLAVIILILVFVVGSILMVKAAIKGMKKKG